MGTRQSFYLESLAEASTTSTTPQVKATLTFTPDADATYWLIASGAFVCTAAAGRATIAVHHVEAGLDLLLQGGQVKEASSPLDWIPYFGIARLSFGSAPGEQSIEVRYASESDGDITKIRDARVLVLRADAADRFAASDDEWQTSSISYQDKTTLTFTPESAGDYLVIGNAAMAMDAANTAMRGRLNHTTASVSYGDRVWYARDAWWFQPFAVMEKLTLGASSQTFKLQFRSNSGTLCYYRDARILALRLSAFAEYAFISNQSVQATTSASDTDVLALTQTPAAAAHAIIAIGSFNTTSTTVSGYLNFAKDGSHQAELVREGVNAAAYLHAGVVQRQTLAASPTSWKWRARAETAGTTVNVANLAIAVLQLEATPAPKRCRYMAVAG
jgi:hypothetical protein